MKQIFTFLLVLFVSLHTALSQSNWAGKASFPASQASWSDKASFPAASHSSWTAKATFPPMDKVAWTPRAKFSAGPRSAACGFAIGDYGYVFGGTNLSTDYSELYQYDPSADNWSKKASMPIAGMREPAGFSIDSVAYIGLGVRPGATAHLSHMYKYSPATNSWTKIRSFYQGRRAAAGFSIDSLGYIIGGYEYGSTPDNSLWSYYPKLDTWVKKATMPGSSRSYPTCGVVRGKAYVMGGLSSGGNYLKDFYCYNPKTNSWTTLSSFPGNGRTTASCIVMDTIIYFGCGKDAGSHYKDWWGYNTVTNQWFQITSFPSIKTYSNVFFSIGGKGYITTGAYNSTLTDSTFELVWETKAVGRTAACGFSLGNKGYVFGGTDFTADYSELFQFDPAGNTWSKKANMPIAGMREPAGFAIDSVAFIGLGFRSGATTHLSHMYKYSPATNSWTAVKSFYEGRRAATGFAIDSLGYIIGGYQYGFTPDNSLYSYSPKTNSWTKRATMPGSGRSYPAAGVIDGVAYVMGGLTAGGGYLKDFYAYNPKTNSWATLSNFPGNGRTTASCVVIDSIIYFGCGKNATTHFQDWWGYITTTGEWFQITGFPSIKTYSNVHFSIGGKGYATTGAFNSTLSDSTFELTAFYSGAGRTAACGFSIGNKGYVFGGTDFKNDFSDLNQFDPTTNTWTKKSNMPLAGMREPAAFVIDSIAYVGLGVRSGAASHLTDMYRYSPTTNTWKPIKNFYQGRRAATGFSLGSLGYIIGGYEYGAAPDNSLWSYAPTLDTWTKKATMPGTARSYVACGVLNGKAYTMGGLTSGGVYLKDFYQYNPSTNTWTSLPDFPGNGRAGASVIVIGDVLYFGCGKNATTHFQDWWGFNIATGTWTQILSFPGTKTYANVHFSIAGRGYITTGAKDAGLADSTFELNFSPRGRAAACGFAIGNYGYVFGGTDLVNEYADLHQFDPAANIWTKKASMPLAGMREPAAFVIDTVAYVGLGLRPNSGAHLSHMYKYNPATNTWTAIKSFYEGRRAATGFSIDSLGYIIGGYEYGYTPDNSLYAYSPKTNTWTKKATMPGTGRSYVAAGVVNGIAYAMGGLTSSAVYLNDFYSYNPKTNTWTTLANFPGNVRTTASCLVIDSVIYFGNGKTDIDHFSDWWGYNTVTKKWSKIVDFPSQKTYGNAYFTIKNKGYISTGAKDDDITDSTFELTVITSSIAKIKSKSDVVIEHASGTGSIQLYSSKNENISIRIYDANGKLVMEKNMQVFNTSVTLSMPEIAHGIYIVEAIQGNSRQSKKIIF